MSHSMPVPASEMSSFALRQRITMMVNRYEVRAGGKDGPLVALAQQKRMALREQVTFFADEQQTQPLFGFKARQRLDVAATYDINDAEGRPIGWFKKDFAASMLRSTWLLGVPAQGLEGKGEERNAAVAILRRFFDLAWPIHFDFAAGNGQPLLSVQRGWGLRDAYACDLPAAPNGQRLDWRVAACLAVACDALMAR